MCEGLRCEVTKFRNDVEIKFESKLRLFQIGSDDRRNPGILETIKSKDRVDDDCTAIDVLALIIVDFQMFYPHGKLTILAKRATRIVLERQFDAFWRVSITYLD